MRWIVGSSPNQVKPKTIKLVFVASLLSTHHWGERTKTGWLGISIMSWETCLFMDFCFSELKSMKFSTRPGLTTLAENRETWLLPQRTWGRSEGMTGRLPTTSIHRDISAKMCCFFAFVKINCIWSVSLLVSFWYPSYLTLNSCFVLVLLLLILYLSILDFIRLHWNL